MVSTDDSLSHRFRYCKLRQHAGHLLVGAARSAGVDWLLVRLQVALNEFVIEPDVPPRGLRSREGSGVVAVVQGVGDVAWAEPTVDSVDPSLLVRQPRGLLLLPSQPTVEPGLIDDVYVTAFVTL